MFKILEPKKQDSKLIITVIANEEYWKKLLTKSFKKLELNLELKGFRKGKIPVEIAKQHISLETIRNEAVNLLIDDKINEINAEIIKEQIISRPKLYISKITDEEVEIEFITLLMPEITIPNLDNLKFEIDSVEPTDEEYEEEFSKLNQILKESREIDGEVELHDVLNINFVGKLDGKEFEGGTANDYELEIGSKSFIDNFEDQLIGMKKGDKATIKVKFPETYPVEEFANRDAEFDVEINKIKRSYSLDEKEINQKIKAFGFNSFEEFKTSIKNNFKEQKKIDVYNKFIRRIIGEIRDNSETKLEIPDELINEEIDHNLKVFKEQLEKSKMNLKDYLKMINKTEEEFKNEDLKQNAITKITEQLLFEKIDSLLDFKITEEEINAKYKELAENQKTTIEELKDQIPEQKLNSELRFIKLVEHFIK